MREKRFIQDSVVDEFSRRRHRFAGEFYEPSATPRTLAGKLGDAQRAMISRPEWETPYYWAGYRLSGTNR